MKYIVLSVVLFLLAAGTQADDVAAGSACTVNDTCAASTTCDDTANKCLIIAGKPCQDDQDNCVTNAACDTEGDTVTCKCEDEYKANDKGICEPTNAASSLIISLTSLILAALVGMINWT